MNRNSRTTLADCTRPRTLDLPGRGRFLVWEAGSPGRARGVPAAWGDAHRRAQLVRRRRHPGPALPGDHLRPARPRRGPRGSRFRLEDCADDVAALAETLGIERIVPVGYSMGGFVAQLLWRRQPDLVTGLVLCSTSRNVCGSPWERTVAMMLPGAGRHGHLVPRLLPAGRRHARQLAARSRSRPGRPLLGARPDAPHHAARRAASRSRPAAHSPRTTGPRRSTCPPRRWSRCAIRWCPPRRQYKLARALPDNTTIEIDADHGAFLSFPDQFAAAVLAACDVVCGVTDTFGAPPGAIAS